MKRATLKLGGIEHSLTLEELRGVQSRVKAAISELEDQTVAGKIWFAGAMTAGVVSISVGTSLLVLGGTMAGLGPAAIFAGAVMLAGATL